MTKCISKSDMISVKTIYQNRKLILQLKCDLLSNRSTSVLTNKNHKIQRLVCTCCIIHVSLNKKRFFPTPTFTGPLINSGPIISNRAVLAVSGEGEAKRGHPCTRRGRERRKKKG